MAKKQHPVGLVKTSHKVMTVNTDHRKPGQKMMRKTED
jgi:hypothetical protein